MNIGWKKIIRGICGKNYSHKDRQGRILWSCSTYLKYGKDSCPSKQIPEKILISLVTEVLELKEFDEGSFAQKIKEIQVPQPSVLVFVFHDGSIVKKGWSYKSRSESWSEEARQKARERSLEKLEGRS
jgi:site-specific DNA recombinase